MACLFSILFCELDYTLSELLAAKANVDRILNMEAEHDAEKEKDHGQR